MKILGITDSRNTCDNCGRTNLKRTVAIELDTGDVVYYGTECATRKRGNGTMLKFLKNILMKGKNNAYKI